MTEEQRKQVLCYVEKDDLNDKEKKVVRSVMEHIIKKRGSESIENLCGIIMTKNLQPEKRNTILIPNERIMGYIATLLLKGELFFANDIVCQDFSTYIVRLDKPRV